MNKIEKAKKNLTDIVNLDKEEIKKQDKNATAILDIKDIIDLDLILKELNRLQKESKSKGKAYFDCYCEYKHYKQFESISKDKIKNKIIEIQFECQQNFKDFEDSPELNILQKLLEEEE